MSCTVFASLQYRSAQARPRGKQWPGSMRGDLLIRFEMCGTLPHRVCSCLVVTCPRLIGSCLDLASPRRGKKLAAFTCGLSARTLPLLAGTACDNCTRRIIITLWAALVTGAGCDGGGGGAGGDEQRWQQWANRRAEIAAGAGRVGTRQHHPSSRRCRPHGQRSCRRAPAGNYPSLT